MKPHEDFVSWIGSRCFSAALMSKNIHRNKANLKKRERDFSVYFVFVILVENEPILPILLTWLKVLTIKT